MRGKTPWLLFFLALAAVAVPLAQGTSGATDPRVAGLVRKVNTLQRQTNTLQRQVATLTARSNCLNNIAPVSRYGGFPDEGYLYKRANETNTTLEGALDITEQGATPNMLFPTVDAQCVSSARVPAARVPDRRARSGVRLLRFKPALR